MKDKLKGKNFQKLKKRGNKHWGYPIKIRSTKIRVQAKQKYKDTVFTKLFNNKAATKHCIEHGVLREFLLKNKTEVVAMLLGVYDKELEKQAIREKEREKAEANTANVVIDIALGSGYSNEEILATL